MEDEVIFQSEGRGIKVRACENGTVVLVFRVPEGEATLTLEPDAAIELGSGLHVCGITVKLMAQSQHNHN